MTESSEPILTREFLPPPLGRRTSRSARARGPPWCSTRTSRAPTPRPRRGTWPEHRYDWTPGSSEWYVDGVRVAAISFQTPASPLSVLFNVWSDGGVWSGEMEVGRDAEM
ncbi:hypothetical protein F5X97DRAFT_282906 [Nemania serpens]|nr:hypothetical protein F5X97DRAFT_282906 [Nemania serpens]